MDGQRDGGRLETRVFSSFQHLEILHLSVPKFTNQLIPLIT